MDGSVPNPRRLHHMAMTLRVVMSILLKRFSYIFLSFEIQPASIQQKDETLIQIRDCHATLFGLVQALADEGLVKAGWDASLEAKVLRPTSGNPTRVTSLSDMTIEIVGCYCHERHRLFRQLMATFWISSTHDCHIEQGKLPAAKRGQLGSILLETIAFIHEALEYQIFRVEELSTGRVKIWKSGSWLSSCKIVYSSFRRTTVTTASLTRQLRPHVE